MKQILQIVNNRLNSAFVAVFSALPFPVAAVSNDQLFSESMDKDSNTVMIVATFLIISAVLTRIWMGIMNYSSVAHDPIDLLEARKRSPYLPSFKVIITTVVCTAGLFLLSIKTMGGIVPFDGPDSQTKAAIFFGIMGLVSVAAEFLWPKAKYYVFAFSIGTLVTFILVGFYYMLFDRTVAQDPFFMALGIVCVVIAWRFLFGPWRPKVKATVLGTFILWLSVHILLKEAPSDRTARLLATFIAFIPAVIWCMLFLKEHKQRMSLVILMFFSGMLSTAPILFYDMMVRHKVELQFFLFKVTPENFTRSTNAFVSGNLVGVTGMKSTLVATLISFLIVGLIEEVSKFWVLKKSGQNFFSSIDDVLQLGIIVAIGFAFAENVLNPSYFISFVRSYLINPEVPQWGAFMGNVLGRAILTNMVHILSTGVFAYCYGLALFAGPVIEEEHKNGRVHIIPHFIHNLFRIPEKMIFRREMMIIGLMSSVVLHGVFNFLVTLPDLLPGNPRTLGDIFGSAPDSFLHYIALLIIPSMFYVVGGFWILSVLFYRKQVMKERGVLVESDNLVDSDTFYAQYAK
ncbi:PrsW family intramembrane metalloprotease [Candidatus Peregrinibacteria bacterium]|nr:PrsW family intramembrane metalloprotease [Candidatus Peregrinibacteria bacterium]MBT5468911.1 PrsW family intramembrane metalloprotease [Candidatus Peregrinibacteria bacterium]MBT7337731.1 PrsW family intramembrane metalloprotease [Candidatus Peregrinibacteria bacterium]